MVVVVVGGGSGRKGEKGKGIHPKSNISDVEVG